MVAVLALSALLQTQADTVVEVGAGAEFDLVWIEPGEFRRPSGREDADSSQLVRLSEGFWLGRFEVTWEQWSAVMGWNDDRQQPMHPARGMNWLDVQAFLARITEAAEGLRFRLPTEAEWEYAARAGTQTPWSSGADSLEALDVAWVRANAGAQIREVGTRGPNPWGLHDMHGNVWEWVADWYAEYPQEPAVTDPRGPPAGTERVRRGGSAIYGTDAARSSHRYQQNPARGNGNIGFRVVAVSGPDVR